MGSNYFPAGPHGQRQDPREVPRHPGDMREGSQSGPQSGPQPARFGFPQPAPFPVRTDAGPAMDGCTNIILSFVLVSFSFALWACLYPMPTLGGVFVFLATLPFFQRIVFRFDPTFGSLAIVLAFTAGMIVLVKLSRVEHRLARYAVYRWPRHLLRLLLFAILTVRSTVMDADLLPRPGQPLLNQALLHTQECQVILLVTIVGMHLLLWKGEPVRRLWHGRLEAIGLRRSE